MHFRCTFRITDGMQQSLGLTLNQYLCCVYTWPVASLSSLREIKVLQKSFILYKTIFLNKFSFFTLYELLAKCERLLLLLNSKFVLREKICTLTHFSSAELGDHSVCVI